MKKYALPWFFNRRGSGVGTKMSPLQRREGKVPSQTLFGDPFVCGLRWVGVLLRAQRRIALNADTQNRSVPRGWAYVLTRLGLRHR